MNLICICFCSFALLITFLECTLFRPGRITGYIPPFVYRLSSSIKLLLHTCRVHHIAGSLLPCDLAGALTLFLLNTTCPVLTNSVDPAQLASEEAN